MARCAALLVTGLHPHCTEQDCISAGLSRQSIVVRQLLAAGSCMLSAVTAVVSFVV